MAYMLLPTLSHCDCLIPVDRGVNTQNLQILLSLSCCWGCWPQPPLVGHNRSDQVCVGSDQPRVSITEGCHFTPASPHVTHFLLKGFPVKFQMWNPVDSLGDFKCKMKESKGDSGWWINSSPFIPLGGLSYSVIYKTLPQNPVISFMWFQIVE